MKKILLLTLVFTLAVCLGVLINLGKETNYNYYSLTTEVVDLDRQEDVVICEDCNGNLWSFYGCEDWMIGDCASLLMYDNRTPIIYDDIICGARFGAWNLTKMGEG